MRTASSGSQEITRTDYNVAVHQLGILEALAAYDPHIAGAPPRGIHTEAGDIDILFSTRDPGIFVADVSRLYGQMNGFRIWQWTSKDRPVVATFRAYGWDFERAWLQKDYPNPTLGWTEDKTSLLGSTKA